MRNQKNRTGFLQIDGNQVRQENTICIISERNKQIWRIFFHDEKMEQYVFNYAVYQIKSSYYRILNNHKKYTKSTYGKYCQLFFSTPNLSNQFCDIKTPNFLEDSHEDQHIITIVAQWRNR